MDEDEARLKDKQEQEQNKNNASKLIKAVEEVRQESERSKLLNQLKSLQVNIEDGENKLKTLLGLDKEEKIRQQQIMSLNEKDLKVLIERMEN
ncbi:hypothetical protein KPH14_012951 [Odynerus spinipes]|uniref:Uncharacterized protein n=1 Tax=Odynerus spinipes TaxID=1348599 RepID=A0AAD9R8A9_9HYME|nr:hypothetical protein KPH14_012951 [Odynerus spinipes]